MTRPGYATTTPAMKEGLRFKVGVLQIKSDMHFEVYESYPTLDAKATHGGSPVWTPYRFLWLAIDLSD